MENRMSEDTKPAHTYGNTLFVQAHNCVAVGTSDVEGRPDCVWIAFLGLPGMAEKIASIINQDVTGEDPSPVQGRQ